MPKTTPLALAKTIATTIKFLRLRLINKKAKAAIIPNAIINVCDAITNDNINSKPDSKPNIKKLTDNPSLYKVIIKAINTSAKPVSSCNTLIISNGTPKIATAMMVFL